MSRCGTDITTCTCGCYGCKFHCGAHWPWHHRIDSKLRPWRWAWNVETNSRGVKFRQWVGR